jgi:hypothetical protein
MIEYSCPWDLVGCGSLANWFQLRKSTTYRVINGSSALLECPSCSKRFSPPSGPRDHVAIQRDRRELKGQNSPPSSRRWWPHCGLCWANTRPDSSSRSLSAQKCDLKKTAGVFPGYIGHIAGYGAASSLFGHHWLWYPKYQNSLSSGKVPKRFGIPMQQTFPTPSN